MRLINWNNLTKFDQDNALARAVSNDDHDLQHDVANIIHQVRQDGDKALLDYALRFDKVNLANLKVTNEEYQAINQLTNVDKQAVRHAIHNIRNFHERCKPHEFEYTQAEINLGKIYRPIEKVGLYIPGGSAPLVSTLLMLAIPAQIAGCNTKVLVTPPQANGSISPAILFAAKECGIENIYKVGGAQAIAALAYGTETIPKTYKIFGPGNKYVVEAKIQVSRDFRGAAIDMPAGPSEVLVIADSNANAEFIASDLLAQAEHDPDAHVVLLTPNVKLAENVLSALKVQSAVLSRKVIIEQSLHKSVIIIAANLAQCFDISNQYAPEHLILHIDDAKSYLPLVNNAGSVFVGEWSPEAVGDYASGTNHVLPTYGYAKMYSGLDTMAFMKSISFQHLTPNGLQHIGPSVETLAALEGLDAHKNAVSIRLKALSSSAGHACLIRGSI